MSRYVGTLTIASSGTESTPIAVPEETRFVGLIFPTMTSGTISIEVSADSGSNWVPLYRPDGSAWQITASTGQFGIWMEGLSALAYFRVKSSAAQGAARTITAIFQR
jgi:hypothetical protein